MLLGISELLETKKIILGSCKTKFINIIVFALESKPRKQLLENQGIKFEIFPSNFEEDFDKSKYSDPKQYVIDTCLAKAKILKENLKNNFDILICADTIMVSSQGKIIEKPKDSNDAYQILKQFSNNKHFCHSCVYIAYNNESQIKEIYDTETSEIKFGEIPEIALQKYSKLPEILNAAGGYAIQGLAGSFVQEVNGCLNNIIGLPLHKFSNLLLKILEIKN